MQNADVHKLLRAQAHAAMRSWGFEPTASGRFSYRRQMVPSGYLFVSAHVGRHAMGWFRIELAVGATHRISQAEMWNYTYSQYLSDADRKSFNDAANIIRRERGVLKEWETWGGDDLPFTRPEHVVMYARAFRVMLPRIINAYIRAHHLPLDPLPE